MPGLPADANVIEVTFEVCFLEGDTGDSEEYACSLYVMAKPWKASEVNWHNATSTETWDQLDLDTRYYDADLQDTVEYPGGGDRLFPCAAVAPVASLNHPWESFTVTDAVKKYVKNPGSFCGLLLKPYLGNIGRWYASSDHAEQAKRPKLTIKYSGTGIIDKVKQMSLNTIRIKGKGVLVFIPLSNQYQVSIMDLKGRLIHSFAGTGQSWYAIPAEHLIDGINIICAKNRYTTIAQEIVYVK